jgi:hypothetical protein
MFIALAAIVLRVYRDGLLDIPSAAKIGKKADDSNCNEGYLSLLI